MSDQFSYSVETPEGLAAGGQCDFLVLPTTRGEVGVLVGHAPLLAQVIPGEMRVSRAGAAERITVGPGVAEVRDDSVHLFVMSAARTPAGT